MHAALRGHRRVEGQRHQRLGQHVRSRAGAEAAGHQIRTATLSQMAFDPDFGQASFHSAPALEPDLETFREDLLWADHVVLVAPMWWGGLPARTKGLFDRILLPGFDFDPRQRRMGAPTPLLSGRTAHFMLTSDTPAWAFWLMDGRALKQQVHRQILSFVGLKPVRHTHFSPVEHSTPERRARWLADTRLLGSRPA